MEKEKEQLLGDNRGIEDLQLSPMVNMENKEFVKRRIGFKIGGEGE